MPKKSATRKKEAAPDVIVLCGGLGMRLREVVSDRPKVLAEVGGQPFLSLLLDEVRAQGFPRIILCVGYGGHLVRKQFRTVVPPLIFSEETEPLGTGGAVKKALPLVRSEDFLVLNGDTFCPLPLPRFLAFHRARRATISLALSRSTRSDGGVVVLDAEGRVTDFKEKAGSAADSFLNAGVYIARKEVAAFFPPASAFSLEHDVFPSVARSFSCFGFVTDREALDIGTPERYHEAVRRFNKKRRPGADET